jgi:hypothetical protein
VTLPAPQPGLVLRYSYLWARDAEQGREEAGKDRPAVIVLVVQDAAKQTARVYVLPITHSHPSAGVEGEIPAAVAKTAGIDAGRSWVIVSEFAKVRDRWLEADAAAKSQGVQRDE